MNPLILSSGVRKYLNAEERFILIDLVQSKPDDAGLLCWILLETGCRISEALALQRRNIDSYGRTIIFECLKKRRRGIFRAVPVSDNLVHELDRQFHIMTPPISGKEEQKLWHWSRTTAYRHVRATMRGAGIYGQHASPKGLRHGFGVAAVSAGIPINLVQRWLGHADMKTTAIYTNAMGPEERLIASRIWRETCASEPAEEAIASEQCPYCLYPLPSAPSYHREN